MATHVIAPDVELVLTGFLRGILATTAWSQAFVSNRLTPRADGSEVPPSSDFAVIVRSDGGTTLEPPTLLRVFGIRVFGPDDDDNHMRTDALARHVAATLQVLPFRTAEAVSTRAVNGPYRVPPTVSRPESYITAEIIFVGAPIEL